MSQPCKPKEGIRCNNQDYHGEFQSFILLLLHEEEAAIESDILKVLRTILAVTEARLAMNSKFVWLYCS